MTHADLSVYVCVCVFTCMGKGKCEYIHCTYCFPCSQAAPGSSVSVCEGRQAMCAAVFGEPPKKKAPHLLSSLLLLFSLLGGSVSSPSLSLFVPALILLSEPWLASLTAAEHRSYSTPTNITHPCHTEMMLVNTHARMHTCFTYSPFPLQHTPESVMTDSAIIFCKLSELIAFTQPSVNCNPALKLHTAWVMGHSRMVGCAWYLSR